MAKIIGGFLVPHDPVMYVEPDAPAKEVAEIVFGNVYTQWGDIEYQKVSDIITSMFGN